jgi:hypothetical protein
VNLFQTYSLRQTIKNSNFNLVNSFIADVELKLYYVMNFRGKNIFVYNEFWEYQRIITPPSSEYPVSGPGYSINSNGTIYIQADDVTNKYDSNLNLTKQIRSPGWNKGIYYNAVNQMIYSGRCGSFGIDVYNKDLNFSRTISTNYYPWFITEYSGQMVVTDNSFGKIYFYQGDSFNKTVTTNFNGRITSVLFDNNNQMLLLYENSNSSIYNVDGTYTGLQISFCNNTAKLFVNFDLKDRLVVLCDKQIEIYY